MSDPHGKLNPERKERQMVFYNGFNLLVDFVLVTTAALWFHGVGYRRAKNVMAAKYARFYQPPF